jgi:probable F420-dependent oxidoreductase
MTRGHGLLETAQRAEALGYHSLSLADHFGDQAAPLIALAAAAMVTTRLRLAPLVCCNDFRHPVVLAKEAATLDVLSGGRLQLGMGAGWMDSDYFSSGIPMDRAGLRIARLRESIQIVRGLLLPGPFSFQGEYYRIQQLEGRPQPVQRPVPLYLGGGGPKMLQLAAHQADIVGINVDLRSNAMADIDFSAEACDRKVSWVRQAAAGRWSSLHLSMLLHQARFSEDQQGAFREIAIDMECTPEVVSQSPSVLVGTPQQVMEILQERRERWGLNEWIVREEQMDAFAPVVSELTGR